MYEEENAENYYEERAEQGVEQLIETGVHESTENWELAREASLFMLIMNTLVFLLTTLRIIGASLFSVSLFGFLVVGTVIFVAYYLEHLPHLWKGRVAYFLLASTATLLIVEGRNGIDWATFNQTKIITGLALSGITIVGIMIGIAYLRLTIASNSKA